MAEKDRKSRLRDSMASEKDALAKRFDMVDQVMQERPGGLLGSTATDSTAKAGVEKPSDLEEGQSLAEQNSLSNEIDESNVVQIHLDKLQDNPYNARQIYSIELVKERAASIAKNGQLTAATVATDPNKPGSYFLIDGHYRKRALKLLERNTMNCVIRTVKTQVDLYRLSFVLNEERSGQTALDNALAWRLMLDQGTIQKEEDICDLTSMSWPNVNKTLSLTKLPTSVIERISEVPTKFGIALGYELVQFYNSTGEDATLNLIDRILEEDLSSRAVEKYRKQLGNNFPRKPREISRQYKIKRNGQNIGFIKDWDSGKLTIEITGLDANERTELVNEVKNRFKIIEAKEQEDSH
jgi:ParB family chromosome partitioning protein